MAASKKSSKKSDPEVDYTSQLVDHMAQGNAYVPPAPAEDEPAEES